MTLQLLLQLNHKSINPFSYMCAYTHTDSHQQKCAHMHMVVRTHKVATLRGYQLQHTIMGFIRCFTFFLSLSLCFHFPSLYGIDRWMEKRGEWGKRRERGGGVGCFLLSLSFFIFESKLNLNSLLPYADLPRNVPYALKFIKQYWRQTLNETKY